MKSLKLEKVEEVIQRFLTRPRKPIERMEILIGGSLKGEMREEWEALQRRLIRIRQRRAKLIASLAPKLVDLGFKEAYDKAKESLGEPTVEVKEVGYCLFLIYTAKAFEKLTEELLGFEEGVKVGEYIDKKMLKFGGITIQAYRDLGDHLSKLASKVRGDKAMLENVAMAAELLDIALAVELTSQAASYRERWSAIASFFDKSLNIHIFDYKPYLYTKASFSRDAEFNEVFTRQEFFELMMRRYGWLYNYIKRLIEERTELRGLGRESLRKLLTIGTGEDPVAKEGGYLEASRFVFSYARLRDLATLYHDGFFIPEVLDDVDPRSIKHEERVNIAIMYNLGNTTAITFLKRGPYHHKGKGPDKNIIMTSFLQIGIDPKSLRNVVYANYGLMYLTKEEYEAAGGRNDILKLIPDPKERERLAKIGPEGRLVFLRFKKPMLVSSVFPHFTHPWFLNQTLEKLGVPLNQTKVIDRVTYEKTLMPDIIKEYNKTAPPERRVDFLEQRNIWREEMRRLSPLERRVKVEELLRRFSKKHPMVMIKTSAESGGRGSIVAMLRDDEGNINNLDVKDSEGNIEVYGFKGAVEFILNEIIPKDDALIQEFIESRPREVLTKEAWGHVKSRFASTCINISDETPMYWSFRNYVTQAPGEKPKIVGWIMLIHVKHMANVGQGGQLFLLEDDMVNPSYSYILPEMEKVSLAMTEAIEKYGPKLAAKRGIEVGQSLAGYSYYTPLTNLSDTMLKPIYKDGKVVGWKVIPIEENIGMGLFYPHEKLLASKGRSGEAIDPILINLALVGQRYLKALGR